jgi:hypothetical protein
VAWKKSEVSGTIFRLTIVLPKFESCLKAEDFIVYTDMLEWTFPLRMMMGRTAGSWLVFGGAASWGAVVISSDQCKKSGWFSRLGLETIRFKNDGGFWKF